MSWTIILFSLPRPHPPPTNDILEYPSWVLIHNVKRPITLQDLFNSAFDKFEYTGNFGLFQKDNYIIFHVENFIPLNLLVFLPAILLGGIGGVLGALFTFLNLKVSTISNFCNLWYAG
jgi:hypothetical protein